MRQCEAGNHKDCFKAAQVIEKEQNNDDNRANYRLYMDGCARGDGNACANECAAVKNASWSVGKPPAAIRAKCQFTTYKRMSFRF